MEYTIEDPKRKRLSKGVHLYVPKEPPLRNGDEKGCSNPKKGDNTNLSTGCKRWPREKFRKLFIRWYWYIYIYIYYDGSQYKDIYIFLYIYILYMKYLMIKYWWVTCYEFVVRIIYLKGLFPHLEVSKFYLLSYLTSLYFPLQIH